MTDTRPSDGRLEAALTAYADALGSTIPASAIPSDGDDRRSGGAASAGDTGDVADLTYGSADLSSGTTGSSNRSSRVVIAAAVLAFCVIAVALVVGHGRISPVDGSHGWSKLPAAPIAGRFETTVIWTGSQFLVFGGFDPKLNPDQGATVGTSAPPAAPAPWHPSERPLDGAAYDPAAKKWSPIAEPPVPAGSDVLAVATSSDVLTVLFGPAGCGNSVGAVGRPPNPGGATYDLTTRSWAPMPALPEVSTCDLHGARVGTTLYVWGGFANGQRKGFAFGPAGTWSSVPATPLSAVRDIFVSGGQIYAFSGAIGGAVDTGASAPNAQAAVYDPGSSVWTVLPDPLIVPVGGAFDLNGAVFVWDGQRGAVLTGPAGSPTWRTTADIPLSPRWNAATATVGGRFVVWGGTAVPEGLLATGGGFIVPDAASMLSDGATYDPVTDAWQQLPPAPIAARSATGSAGSSDELFIWGGTDTNQSSAAPLHDGALFRPMP
jgi:hypothetical protein